MTFRVSFRPPSTVVTVGVATVLGGFAAASALGLRFNTTHSMPVGIWQVSSVVEPLRRGITVTACAPPVEAVREGEARGYLGRGSCPDGFEPLVKQVVAVSGDVVRVGNDGITVNDRHVSNTVRLSLDSAGRPMRSYPEGRYVVASGEAWLVGKNDRLSWDSRYFGPVPESAIIGMARPLLVRP